MSTIELTEQELTIRKQLIKVASEGKTLYYSDLVKEEDATLVYSLGTILEKITRYDIENKQPILASIVVLKSTGLPSEGFFELLIFRNGGNHMQRTFELQQTGNSNFTTCSAKK